MPSTESIAVPIPTAASMLGCSIRAIRALIWRGDLPHIKLGKKFVIRVVDLHSYAERAAVRL
jgi:excisionase family DNA binding protein